MVKDVFPASRNAALARLAQFIPGAGQNYAFARNTDPGPEQPSAVSKLSPYLRYRIITEQEVVQAVLEQHSLAAAEKFIQEVLWRTYWKGWLEMRPSVWTQFQEERDRQRDSFPNARAIRNAEAGQTGIEGFDDWARELVATGYLHNHARMWFASIWIFTLRLPWELGAAFFFEHLLDGDAASNTLSWRWVAGLQTAGKTYVARADNIAHYTEGRCAPAAGQLAPAAFAITEEPLPKVAAWTEDGLWSATAATGGAGERVGLWLHAEDLAVEIGELAGENIASVNAAWPTGIAARAGWGESVAGWTRSALGDGATRAGAHFGVVVMGGATDDLAAELVEWAKTQGLRRVVAYRPCIGPWLDEGLAAERALGAAGIALTWRRRAWDTELFPHAGRGYFPFWERVKAAG